MNQNANDMYDEIALTLGCAIYNYVGGEKTFRPEFFLHDVVFMSTRLAKVAAAKYREFVLLRRETEEWQEWYYKKLYHKYKKQYENLPPEQQAEFIAEDLQRDRDVKTGKLVCHSNWNLFSYKDKIDKLIRNLTRRQIIKGEYQHIDDDLSVVFYSFIQSKENLELIKKMSFLECI
jgi:hypothetical protein